MTDKHQPRPPTRPLAHHGQACVSARSVPLSSAWLEEEAAASRGTGADSRTEKARIVTACLISMARTGYKYYFQRPRDSRPLSMLKYDPISMLSYRKERESVMKQERCSPLAGYLC